MSGGEDSQRCLVVGALNVDLLGRVARFCQPDEAVEIEETVMAPGGHAGNCAVALARLGAKVRLLASVGNDSLVQIAVRALAEVGVETAYLERTDQAPTGLVFVPVLPDGGKALYVARGANERLSGAGLAEALDSCGAVVVFDPPLSLFPLLGERIGPRLGIFAPGGLVSAAPLAELEPLLDAVDFLIVNRPESRVMTGVDDPLAAARRLAGRFHLHAIVTVGREGCWVADPGGKSLQAPGFPVAVSDTTGAGDAFVAGFSAALLSGSPLGCAARQGCAVGALATRALGAQASLPTPEEVAALCSQGAGYDFELA